MSDQHGGGEAEGSASGAAGRPPGFPGSSPYAPPTVPNPPNVPSAPPGFAGSSAGLPPTAATYIPPDRTPVTRKKRRPWGLLVLLVVVAGAVGGYLVWSDQEDQAEEQRAEKAAAAPSAYGTVLPATIEGTPFRWTAPRSQVSTGWSVPTGLGTQPPGETFEVRRYGDFRQENEEPRQVFDVRAYPASIQATDATETGAFVAVTGRTGAQPEAQPIDVAGTEGVSFSLETQRDEMSADDNFPFEIRVVAVQIDGALIVVHAVGQGTGGVDEKELTRLLDSIVYEPGADPAPQDRAGAEGAKAFADSKLVDVANAEAGFRWRSPEVEVVESGMSTSAESRLDDFTGYTYEDGFTTYEVQVYPPTTQATAEDQARTADYFLANHTIRETGPISIAGAEGVRFDSVYDSPDTPQQVLTAAAAIDGSFITVSAYRSDYNRPSDAEFERLVASITRT